MRDSTKEFDITKHEFSDSKLAFDGLSHGFLVLSAECDQWGGHLNGHSTEELFLSYNKQDAIAIAKALGVTAEDLK